MIRSPTCNLPSLPDSLKPPVGFPEPGDGNPADHIFITKTDYADMLAFIADLKEWIEKADGCLTAGQR